ncbi:hypothetical protein HK098_006317 [Nowakowskiella sp. JEL0407]|nr:hypothetical protein HK098_006317 [Nowakowskiella sp. JEL0407]
MIANKISYLPAVLLLLPISKAHAAGLICISGCDSTMVIISVISVVLTVLGCIGWCVSQGAKPTPSDIEAANKSSPITVPLRQVPSGGVPMVETVDPHTDSSALSSESTTVIVKSDSSDSQTEPLLSGSGENKS